MNEKNSEEIYYRRLAFKLFDKGKSPTEILALIPRSHSWLFKWKQRFEQHGWQALDSLSKAPHHSPHQYPSDTVKLVARVRKRMEKSHVGLISAYGIQRELVHRRLKNPPPSQSSIKRWIKQAGLVSNHAQTEPVAYYPGLEPTDSLVLFSCDWTERYLEGGEKIFAFHTLNLLTHALAQTIWTDKSTESACGHLLATCSQLGLPDFLQIDNDAAFTGLGRSKRVFGRFVRLALYLGIELLFIPPREPKRNHAVERVNGLWSGSFWNKNHFVSLRDFYRKSEKFLSWYEYYAPPALDGLTVEQASHRQRCQKLLRRQIALLPEELPLSAGRLHFIRKVDSQGKIQILKEQWKVSKSLADQYLWATLDTGNEELSIYHRHSLRAQTRLVKQYAYEIDEKVQPLLPEYRRRKRRIEILKII